MNDTVPEKRINKNGVAVTKHVNPNKGGAVAARSIKAPPLMSAREASRRSVERSLTARGFYEVADTRVPLSYRHKLLDAIDTATESTTGYYRSSIGEYAAIIVGSDNICYSLDIEASLDQKKAEKKLVTVRGFQSWNMSLHPQGPKTRFSCGACSALNEARLAKYTSVRGGLMIRCLSCGEQNIAPVTYG